MTKKVIAVIDLKSFYAFVECVDRGLDPFKTPLVVCDKQRGKNTIILSVSPFLKSQGVPNRLRFKELPKKYNYIFALPRMERYLQRSNEVMKHLVKYVSKKDVHIYSIDEAFIDLTSYINFYNLKAEEIVRIILQSIKNDLGLYATAGIGDNMLLAKVALDIYAKKTKNGIATIHSNEVAEKLWPITPLSKMWGIGQRLETRLNALDIFSIGDLAHSSKEFLTSTFGIIGEQLYNHANGIDEADMHEVYTPLNPSLSLGQVLNKDYNFDETKLIIHELVEDVTRRLRKQYLLTSCVFLYIGYSKEGGISKQCTLFSPTDDSEEIKETIDYIYLKNVDKTKMIRRVSIALSSLSPYFSTPKQGSIFISFEEKEKKHSLDLAIDEIKNKYGDNSCLYASSMLDFSTIKERHSYIGGHKR